MMHVVKEFPFQVVRSDREHKIVIMSDGEQGDLVVMMINGEQEYPLLAAWLDQWGIWFHLPEHPEDVVAWEMGTLSFLEAYANALAYLREVYEP